MDNIWVFTSLAGYPLYYYYIRLLTVDVKINFKRIFIILLPAFILSAYSFIIYFLMTPQELNIFIQEAMYHKGLSVGTYPLLVEMQVIRLLLFKIIFFAEVVLAVYFGYKLIIRYNRYVKEFYSNIGGKDLSPVKWVLLAFIFASIISITSNLIGKDFFVDKGFCWPSRLLHTRCFYFL